MTEVSNARAAEIVLGSEESPGWLDRSYFDEALRENALAALLERDASGFLACASNECSLRIVWGNQGILTSLGILEAAIVAAIIGTRTNNHRDYPLIRALIERADRERLRSAGDPLPGAGPWTLYRGVSGHGSARRLRGYSWTSDREQAAWLATRFAHLGKPAVVTAEVPTRLVLFYSNEREEEEFLIDLPKAFPVRVGLTGT